MHGAAGEQNTILTTADDLTALDDDSAKGSAPGISTDSMASRVASSTNLIFARSTASAAPAGLGRKVVGATVPAATALVSNRNARCPSPGNA